MLTAQLRNEDMCVRARSISSCHDWPLTHPPGGVTAGWSPIHTNRMTSCNLTLYSAHIKQQSEVKLPSLARLAQAYTCASATTCSYGCADSGRSLIHLAGCSTAAFGTVHCNLALELLLCSKPSPERHKQVCLHLLHRPRALRCAH